MKKKNFLPFFMVCLLSITACSNDETVTDHTDANKETTDGTTFTGGTEQKINTRTSLDMVYPGGSSVNYFWEVGDKIWTADGVGSTAMISGKSATAKFMLPRRYTTPTVEVYYPGKNATAYNRVNISTSQRQNTPNSTQHLGEAGDCGVATANRLADGTYQFNLDHKAAVICILPRTPHGLISTVIQSIKVTADNNIAGIYTLTGSGLTGNGSSKTITLTTNNFPLNNAATSQGTNAAYVVIAPGTHALTIEYTLYDTQKWSTGIYAKAIAARQYDANTVTPITTNIVLNDYSGVKYYQWDAINDYWYGTTVESTDYPNSFNDPRGRSSNQEPHTGVQYATHSAANAKTANEMAWYVQYGDAYYDNGAWVRLGHLYGGGVWLKRESVIAAEQGTSIAAMKQAAPDGNNYIQNLQKPSKLISHRGRPSNVGNYFYTPLLGWYSGQTLGGGGSSVSIWGNSAYPVGDGAHRIGAYTLGFNSGRVSLGLTSGIMWNINGVALPQWTLE